MSGGDLTGRLVAHHEGLDLPLWRGHDLQEVVGRAAAGRPLLVVGVDVIREFPGDPTRPPTLWALVTDGACTGWLPTPLHRLTLLDEETLRG